MLTLPSADRGVAQPGQSIGLQNRGPRVRILPPLPPSLARAGTARRGAVSSSEESISALLMSAIKTIDLLYGWSETSVIGMKNGKANGAADAVLYGADGSRESVAMAELLSEMGVEFEYRSVNTDPVARREWEDLDGESIPMLRLGSAGIVRGLDRIKVQQLVGWVGC